ncbi:mechanosensitive ion channel protein MscS [Actinomycetospora sp. NBRC 106375]|uniref:mechanosensitive ion channel family protein n=1 Tax=Actinomycetospora sp. NBRC 106375 TaxID=3032207 RepID=UPI0024A16130|nr:mechanosensitive ion channel family protein [Actinomycetospora sp. NBRC 106375]GLZ47277.1 mechanosensitive ion channel protein MscS [Actinomycetospora sp. NBRC 106375]
MPPTDLSSPLSLPIDAPACAADQGTLCARVYQLTQADWLSRSADELVGHAVVVLLIIVVAIVLRFAVHRAINRLTTGAREGRVPALLRPLRDRAVRTLRDAAPLMVERRTQRAQAIGSVLRSFSTILIYGVAFVLILGEFGVNLAPIIASAGIVGVAIGFGAQNLVRDFLSGIFMMLEDQYGVGDVVDLGEATGTVEAVGLRVTTLRDIAGTVWYVRNGEVLRVGNSSQGFSVAVVDIPVGHAADVDDALEIAERAATAECAEPKIASKVIAPPEMLGVQSVTAEGVLLRLTIRTRPGEQWAVQRAVAAEIKTQLDAAGVPAPYPFAGRPGVSGPGTPAV